MEKRKTNFVGFLGLLVLLLSVSPLMAQVTKNVTFQVTLAEWYDLYISQSTITFTDVAPSPAQSPATVQIPANEGPVNVRAFAIMVPASSLTLTVVANSDFHTTVPASTVSWTVTGAGYQAGNLINGNAVTVGSWSGSILHWHEGTLNFSFLRDYATQEPGTYSITATYTLSKV